MKTYVIKYTQKTLPQQYTLLATNKVDAAFKFGQYLHGEYNVKIASIALVKPGELAR